MIKGLLFASVFCFGSAAFSQTMPDAATLFENTAVKAALEKNTGATDSLQALRQTGSESLFEPGRRGVDAAYTKSDPTSAAVVTIKGPGIVRPSSRTRPGISERTWRSLKEKHKSFSRALRTLVPSAPAGR